MDCREEYKKQITKEIFDKTLTGNVFTKFNENTINVNYSNQSKFVKNRMQAFEAGLRKVNSLNKEYNSIKYGETASLNHATDKIYINIHPTGRLIDLYQERSEIKAQLEIKNNLQPLSQQVLFQLSNKSIPTNKKIDNILRNFCTKIGVSIELVNDMKERVGVDSIGVSKILEKIIYIAEGKADITTLPEEVGHFFEQLLGENHPLHKSMMNEIVNYPIYKEVVEEYTEQYKGDQTKLKKEAIGKLIGQTFISQIDKTEDSGRFNRWWNKVWQVISKFFLQDNSDFINAYREIAFEENYSNPFEEAANQIINNDTRGLKKTGTDDELFYQLENQKIVIDMLEKSKKVFSYDIEKKDYIINGISASSLGFRRVSSLIRSRFKNAKIPTEQEKSLWDNYAMEGSMIHGMIEHIIKEKYNTLNGKKQTSTYMIPTISGNSFREMTSGEKNIYNKLGEVFNPFAEKIYNEGGIIFNEITVANSKSKTIGTIDMLIINKDGSFDIYDFKTRNKDELSFYKRKEYDSQIREYIKILKEGDKSLFIPQLKDIRKSRILPIIIRRAGRKNKVTNTKDISNIDITLPLPVANEKTKIKELDHNISVLQDRLNNLFYEHGNSFNEKKKEILAEKITELQTTIDNVTLEKSIFEIKDQAIKDLNRLNNYLLGDNITYEKLKEGYYITLLYKDISKGLEKDETINNIETKAKELNETIIKLIEEKLLKEAKENKLIDKGGRTEDNFFDLRDKNTLTKSKFRPRVFSENNLVLLTHAEINKAQNDSRLKLKEFTKNLREKLDTFKKNSGEYKDIINSATGNLWAKYKSEFFTELKSAKENLDLVWAKENLILTKELEEKYEKLKEDKLAIFKSLNSETINDKYTRAKQKGKLLILELNADTQAKKIKILYDLWIRQNPKLLKVGRIKDEEKWKTEEYKRIEKNKTLNEFYNFWLSSMDDFKEITGKSFSHNFIPELRKDITDKQLKLALKSTFSFDWLENTNKEEYGYYNPITNEKEMNVHLPYVHNLNQEKYEQQLIKEGSTEEEAKKLARQFILQNEKSYDLGYILAEFAKAVYDYEAMSSIEDVLDNVQIIASEAKNKQVLDDEISDKDKADIKKGTVHTEEQIRDIREIYLYGQNKKHQIDPQVEKFVDKLMNFTAIKTLGLNIPSALINVMQASTQALVTSQKGFYSTKNILTGYKRAASGDKKTLAFIKLFPIVAKQDVSLDSFKDSWIKRNVTKDNAFVLYKGGDFIIQNGTLGAMLESHTVNEHGDIVNTDRWLKIKNSYYSDKENTIINHDKKQEVLKKIEEDKKNYPSLYSLYEINEKSDELEWKGKEEHKPDKEKILAFINKVKRINKANVANVDIDDVATAKRGLVYRSILMFRNWIQPLFDERFADKNYSYDLEQDIQGRYNVIWNIAKEHGVSTAIKIQLGLIKARTLGLTEQEELAIKANIRELQIILTVISALLLLGMEDDKDKNKFHKWAYKTTNRLNSELTFFISPFSMYDIIKSPFAVTGTLDDFKNLMKSTTKEGIGIITDNEKMQKEAKPIKSVTKMSPIIGNIVHFIDEFKEEKEKEKEK